MPRPLSDEESDHRDEIVARETVASTGSVLLSNLIIASSIPSWPIQLQRRRTSGFKFSLSTTSSRIGYLASSGLLVHPFRLGQKMSRLCSDKICHMQFSPALKSMARPTT